VKVLVEGGQRARIREVTDLKTHYAAAADPVPPDGPESTEVEAMRRALIAQFDQYVKLNKKIPPEILTSLGGIEEAGRLADTIAAHLPLKLEQKQKVLEMFDVKQRLEHLLGQLEAEIDILQVEKRIRGRVKRQMEKSQREYYLNEQVKAIQKELGEARRVPTSKRWRRRSRLRACPRTRAPRPRASSRSCASCRRCPPRRRWSATTSTRSSAFPGRRRAKSPRTSPSPRRSSTRITTASRRSRSASSSTSRCRAASTG